MSDQPAGRPTTAGPRRQVKKQAPGAADGSMVT